ncbi:MAG TPA: VWA domain-containing protein [Capillimicrobium sp.]|nr:VWA domain-containing protein [Capillimicrobium sp.]
MGFHAPLVLLTLLLVAAGAAGYVSLARRRAARAASFANPALLANVAPVSPGWRRHVPMALLGVALVGLIVAAARPYSTLSVPDERASILLLTDISGSMKATDVRPTRLGAAKEAAHRFVDQVPEEVRVGVMAFNLRPWTLQRPTRDREAIHIAIDKLDNEGGTATGEALNGALQLLRPPLEPGEEPAPAAVVLLSDGASTKGADPIEVAREARRQDVPVYTVALGTEQGTITVPRRDGSGRTRTLDVPPDVEAMAQIARITGAETFTAPDAERLSAVYEQLGSQVGTREEDEEIGWMFVGGAIVLLLVGTGLSMAFLGRWV